MVFILIALLPCPSAFAAPQLEASVAVAREGYFVLSWDLSAGDHDRGTALTLQQSSQADFSGDVEQWPVHQADQFTQSGLTNGRYYYRLVSEKGASNVVEVEVQHHALSRAFFFFSLGAVLFILLVVILLHGRRQNARG